VPDETQLADQVVADIQRLLQQPGARASDFAILCRTNEQPRAFETELRRAKLPYVLVGGMSFFDRKEVRDLLAYLKTIDSPNDETAILRIINTPPRGIGNSTVKQLVSSAVSQGTQLWTVLGATQEPPAVARFVGLINEFREAVQRFPLDKLLMSVIERVGYRSELERLYPDPLEREARLASVEELLNAAAAYGSGREAPGTERGSLLRGFLDDIALGARDDGDDKHDQLQRNAIALMTLHSAKGLEFPYVYMVGMEEGILPHKRSLEMPDDRSIDEERRLCYVGVTRAQERLTLSFALTRRKWGKPRESVPSRFLYEMTGQAENARRVPATATMGRQAMRNRRNAKAD
jgi:DNA helicase-2/ATP-dependent DNA helicase PcrA